MPESHTGANLRDSLLATLQEWNLDEKSQLVITTDNAANIKLACRLLNWRQIGCFDHSLDLAVKKGLCELSELLALLLAHYSNLPVTLSWVIRTKTQT